MKKHTTVLSAGGCRPGNPLSPRSRFTPWRAAAWLAAFLLLVATEGRAQYSWSSFAGADTGAGTADAAGSGARFEGPTGLAIDAAGGLYVTDAGNSNVRRITPANSQIGQVTTLAGQAGFRGNADGTGLRARFDDPQGVAVAPNGDVYVVERNSSTIRKITPAGVVTTWAGRAYQHGSTNGDRLTARFIMPTGIVMDPNGVLYVADSLANTIRKIATNGQVTTFAGNPTQAGSTDGIGAAARFLSPTGLALDSALNLYVADTGNATIRKITPAGVVTTIAGTPGSTLSMIDGSRTQARFAWPRGVAVSSQGIVYVADRTNIRIVALDGSVRSMSDYFWRQETPGFARNFKDLSAIVIDPNGTLYVADEGNHAIRRLKAELVTTYAGFPGTERVIQDGIGNAARLHFPRATATDHLGNVYVGDAATIRKITPQGMVTTFAGNGFPSEFDGNGTAAYFHAPSAMVTDPAGNLFVTDFTSGSIRKVSPQGQVTTILRRNFADRNNPEGIGRDAAGNLYVSDSARHAIIKVTPGGVVTPFAGLSGVAGSANGTGSAARFNSPSGIVVNNSGQIFVADTNNQLIRQITPAGVVTTLAGWDGRIGNTDGTGTSAQFYQPRGMKLGLDGSLIVADSFNHLVRRVTTSGVVTTLGGFPGAGASKAGFYRDARFSLPSDVAVAPSGIIYVAESSSSIVSVGTTSARLALEAGEATLPTQGGAFDFGDVVSPSGNEEVRIVVRNTGTTTFTNFAAQVDGPNASDFTVGPLLDTRVSPLGFTAFTISFRPSGIGPRKARVRLTSTGGGINLVEFALTGVGIPPLAIDFVTIYSSNANPSVAEQGDYITLRFHVSRPISMATVAFTRVRPLPPALAPAYDMGGGNFEMIFGAGLLPPGQPVAFYITAGESGSTPVTATQTTDGSSVTVAYYQPPF